MTLNYTALGQQKDFANSVLTYTRAALLLNVWILNIFSGIQIINMNYN